MRLIPAHAGKTDLVCRDGSPHRAHPRSRGENHELAVRYPRARGSSPLTRGKPRPADDGRAAGGLIPAHAGKTSMRTATRLSHRAHPRSRGENLLSRLVSVSRRGSSPLTRGKLKFMVLVPFSVGLIPAHAGKTHPRVRRRGQVRAHPRSRGENEARGEAWRPSQGSSPLTRGKQPNVTQFTR